MRVDKIVEQDFLAKPDIAQASVEKVLPREHDAAPEGDEAISRQTRSLATGLWQRFRDQMRRPRYHPERHYMRGPGPATLGNRMSS